MGTTSDVDKIPSQVVSTDKLDSGYLKQPTDELTVGKWLLFLDEVRTDASGLTELDKAWANITPLLKRRTNKIIRVICSVGSASSASSATSYRKKGFIGCYTADFKDISEVKQIAAEIRAATNHCEVFYYKAEVDSKLKKLSSTGSADISLYKFDENNKLYTRRYGGSWFDVKNAQRLENINPQRLIQMEEESKMILSGTGNSPPEIELIPSRITYKEYLDSGSIKTPKNKLDVGKWMLFPDTVKVVRNGLTKLDLAWAKIVELTKQPGGQSLIRVSCSTKASQRRKSRFSEDNANTGVIKCYTEDFNQISDAAGAAREIRRVTNYHAKLYYKMDVPSEYKGCSQDGYVEQSVYMEDCSDNLFFRSDSGDWKPVGQAKKLQNLAPRIVEGIRKEMKEYEKMYA